VKALVTGVGGFLGSRLAEGLLHHGWEVAGIDNFSTGRAENVPDGVEVVDGDVRRRTDIPRGDWDVVYHLAASYKDRGDWERDASTNVLGTINVVREAQRTGARVVYTQTSLCYGPSPASPVALDAPLDPHGSYAVSKTAGEAYIMDSGLDFVSLRLANIFGPRNLSGPVPAFWKRLTEHEPCTVVDSRRDFVFVDDMVWVAVRAATRGSGVYHIASGSDHPIVDVYRAVADAMGVDAPEPVIVPRGPDDVATLLLDPARTEADFGWTAQTPLRRGIEAAVAYYDQKGVPALFTHLAAKG
jgi:UDP-glucose 4-epimerase